MARVESFTKEYLTSLFAAINEQLNSMTTGSGLTQALSNYVTKTMLKNATGSERTVLTEGFDLTGATDEATHLQTVLDSMKPGQILRLMPNIDAAPNADAVISLGKTINLKTGVAIVGPEGGAPAQAYESGMPIKFEVRTGFVGTELFRVDGTAAAVKDIYLSNFSIDGKHRGAGVTGIHTIGLVTNLEIDHVTIRDMSGNGVWAESSTATSTSPKMWRFNRVMSESHDGWSFLIDGLTDSDFNACQAHTSTLGGFSFAGLGDFRGEALRATWVGGPGFLFANSTRSGNRPWGAGVQFGSLGTDRSNGPGILHTANNINPIVLGTVTLGRDQRNNGVRDDTLAALKVDGGGLPAGPLVIGTLTTMVGYDDSGQDDTMSSPGWAIDSVNSRGISVGSGLLWGVAGQVKRTDATAYITIAPTVVRQVGVRTAPTYVGPYGPATKFSATSATTLGINTAGDRTFTVASGLDFVAGMVVRAASTANPTTAYIEGPIKSYIGTTLVIDGTATRVGTGSPTSWSITAVALTPQVGMATTAYVDAAVSDKTTKTYVDTELGKKASIIAGTGVTPSGRIIASTATNPANQQAGDFVFVVPAA